jgi:hypothetical protein
VETLRGVGVDAFGGTTDAHKTFADCADLVGGLFGASPAVVVAVAAVSILLAIL